MRRYLSWIEGLTTNQYVGGSNPSRRTILDRSEQNRSRLERFFFCQAKERNVLEGSKIETSQYVDFDFPYAESARIPSFRASAVEGRLRRSLVWHP